MWYDMHYWCVYCSLRQQIPMVFSLHLSQCWCLHFWKKVGSMLAQGCLRVKCQAQITKWHFSWVDAINMQSLSGHYLMRQQVPVVFLLLLVFLGAVAYIFVEISLGSCWRRDIWRVKDQGLITNCNFLLLCVICNHRKVTTQCAVSNHGVWSSFNLSECCCFRCCLHFCRNKQLKTCTRALLGDVLNFFITTLQWRHDHFLLWLTCYPWEDSKTGFFFVFVCFFVCLFVCLFCFVLFCTKKSFKFIQRLLVGKNFNLYIYIFFFTKWNEMRDEAKTWWLVSGPDVASSYPLKNENPCCNWITRFPVLLTITVTKKNQQHFRLPIFNDILIGRYTFMLGWQ